MFFQLRYIKTYQKNLNCYLYFFKMGFGKFVLESQSPRRSYTTEEYNDR